MSHSLLQDLRATLKLGLPLIGGQVAQNLINLTDTLMMGRYGATELAAVALGAAYLHVSLILGMGFALAVAPLAGAAVARGDRIALRRATRMGLWIAILFAALMLPALWFSEAILRTLGQAEVIAQMTGRYLRLAGFGILPALMFLVLRSHLSAQERTNLVLWVSLGAVVLNAGLNYILIFGHFGAPELGLTGAAIASVCANGAMCLGLALYAAMARGLREDALFARFWRPDWAAFGQVFRLGWPISLTILAESGLFAATMVMMGWISPMALAAHGVALQIITIIFMIHLGLAQAATVRASHAYGRADLAGLRRAAQSVVILSGAIVALTIAAFWIAPEVLMGAFLDGTDPASGPIIVLGAQLLAVAAVFQLADAGQVIALGLLRGVQDTRAPMWIAVFCYWGIGVPAAYLLGVVGPFGPVGIWMGLVLGLVPAGAAMFWRFGQGLRRQARGLT